MTSGAERSPARIARITGGLFLVMAVGGFAGFGLLDSLVVPGDAARTAGRLLAAPGRWQLAFTGSLVAFLCDVPVAILLYVLLRPAGRTLSLVTAAFRLVYAAIVGANLISQLGAMALLGGADFLSSLTTAQRETGALFLLNLHRQGFSLALIFFAFHLLLLGVLLHRSGWFPRVLGVLILLAGVAYLVDSTSFLLAPALNARLVPFLTVPMSFEILLALWLLVRGGNERPSIAGVPR